MITGPRAGAVPASGQLGRSDPRWIGTEVGPGAVEREPAGLDQRDDPLALGPDRLRIVDPVGLGHGPGGRRTRPRPSTASSGPARHDRRGPGPPCRRRPAAPSCQRDDRLLQVDVPVAERAVGVEASQTECAAPARVQHQHVAAPRSCGQPLWRWPAHSPNGTCAERPAVGRADVAVRRCRRRIQIHSPCSSSATTWPDPDPAEQVVALELPPQHQLARARRRMRVSTTGLSTTGRGGR